MRFPSLHRRLTRSFRRPILGAALLLRIATSVDAEASGNETANRLGFHFDQKAHEAAVAARAKEGGAFLNEPVDPDVIRLPKYTVRDKKVWSSDFSMETPKGRIEKAKKQYLSPMYQKTLGPIAAAAAFLHNVLGGWNPNTPEAMAIYEDNEALRRRNEMSELNGLSELAEKAKQSEASSKK
jgi:hypothetical protein